jgi:2-polyprenyl-6-methoxyphenol hydroxylase-like FAD-dependent oxidoreductase
MPFGHGTGWHIVGDEFVAIGLFLAIELATAGVKPLVLERLVEPDRTIKAAAVGAVGAETLQRRGLAHALDGEERAAQATTGEGSAASRL